MLLNLTVPYVHQVLDVGGANGNWACGPTSLAMVLAYFGKLQPWDGGGEARGAADAGSSFAPYVTSAYSAYGHTYKATARDPSGRQVAGLYGTVCPTGFADWATMRAVLSWHGLQSQQVAATWNGVVGALKRGHPVLIGNGLTPEGHILVATGYTSNWQLVVNDPYGNRFGPGYGANGGKGAVYPWSCTRTRTALEVIGTYPPPRPTQTPTAPPAPTAAPAPVEGGGNEGLMGEAHATSPSPVSLEAGAMAVQGAAEFVLRPGIAEEARPGEALQDVGGPSPFEPVFRMLLVTLVTFVVGFTTLVTVTDPPRL